MIPQFPAQLLLVGLVLPIAIAISDDVVVPHVDLGNGAKLPLLYMGGGNLTEWVEMVGPGAGVKTAWGYHNQPSILPQVYAAGLTREDVFLESMIPCGFVDHPQPQNASTAEAYIQQNLALLNTTYLDLLLIHHRCNSPRETAEVWSALEAALQRGDARAIGVSNFDVDDLKQLQEVAKERIAVNEAHFAVGAMDREMIAFAQQNHIQLVSFSSLSAAVPMDDPVLMAVAGRYNMSAAQVMLKYVSSNGIAVLSSLPSTGAQVQQYAREDLEVFSWSLTKADIIELDKLQTGKRTCPDCYTDDCQHCAQALIDHRCKVGQMPAAGRGNPDSALCLECAAWNKATHWAACGAQSMIEKACGQAGGFPKSPTLANHTSPWSLLSH